MSLVARYLEQNGLPTVLIGNARDIVEHCGVARFLFVDFPLGNPCGEPFNVAQQRAIFARALELLEQAREPRTTWTAPFEWPHGDRWKDLIFTDEQPFLEGDVYDNWLRAKQRYRELKAKGEI